VNCTNRFEVVKKAEKEVEEREYNCYANAASM
jgi:hypothetical protein